MTAQKEALTALVHEMEYVLSCINADKVPFDGDDFHEALRLGKEALAQPEQDADRFCDANCTWSDHHPDCKYGKPEQEPVAWKLVPIRPTEEMLKAMDECSTEGYDERLYAGHAASVYMAAVDVAPTPPKPEQEPVAVVETIGGYPDESAHVAKWLVPYKSLKAGDKLYTTPTQRTWVGLTEEDMDWLHANTPCIEGNYGYRFIRAIEAKLKEKNA